MGGIVWLASYPKSGNTWLRAFLYHLLTDATEPGTPDADKRFSIGAGTAGWYQRYVDKPGDAFTDEELASLRAKVHADIAGFLPDTLFVKTHNFLGEVAGAPLISMDVTAGAIYVVRNPLDVCVSVSHHFGLSLDDSVAFLCHPRQAIAAGATLVREYLSTWAHHVDSWTRQENPRLLVLRYEDMLASPRRTFAGVCRFLGLEVPPAKLRRAIEFSSFKALRRLEEAGRFSETSDKSERFFRAGTAEQWRGVLSAHQVARIVEVNGAQMDRFGYRPEETGRAAGSG